MTKDLCGWCVEEVPATGEHPAGAVCADHAARFAAEDAAIEARHQADLAAIDAHDARQAAIDAEADKALVGSFRIGRFLHDPFIRGLAVFGVFISTAWLVIHVFLR